jgi:hypothetical protein
MGSWGFARFAESAERLGLRRHCLGGCLLGRCAVRHYESWDGPRYASE